MGLVTRRKRPNLLWTRFGHEPGGDSLGASALRACIHPYLPWRNLSKLDARAARNASRQFLLWSPACIDSDRVAFATARSTTTSARRLAAWCGCRRRCHCRCFHCQLAQAHASGISFTACLLPLPCTETTWFFVRKIQLEALSARRKRGLGFCMSRRVGTNPAWAACKGG